VQAKDYCYNSNLLTGVIIHEKYRDKIFK
jgi:hypothetical protein